MDKPESGKWWVKAPLPRGWKRDVRSLGIQQGISLEKLIERAVKEYAEKHGGKQLPESDDSAQDAGLDRVA